MKKQIKLFIHLLLIALSINKLNSQTYSVALTPNGIFDKVGDRFGYFHPLSNLNTDPNAVSNLNPNISNIAIVQTFTAGKFVLHIEQGSLFDISAQSASVLVQVFKDVSGFINSAITNSAYIHIKCGDKSATAATATLSLLAGATQYYAFPSGALNVNQGNISGLVELSLKSGTSALSNFPIAIFPSTNSYYSGYMVIDETASWNTNMATTSISSSDYDMYSIMLHEAGHLLGFASLLNYDGFSKYGATDNYFTNYEMFLRANNGTTPLLVSSTPTTCPNNNVSFNFGAVSNTILGAATGTVVDISSSNYVKYVSNSNTTVAVFTPTCFSGGSSLMHFEDMYSLPPGFTTTCTPTPTSPGANNLYYVMSNGGGSGDCFVKRYFTPEERNVFCDLGYSVSATYTSAATLSGTNTSHSYGGSACSPSLTIVGNHDGLVGNVYTYTTTGTSLTIPFNSLLANDTPSSSIEISCLNLVYSNATITPSSTDVTVTASPGIGLVLLQYTPKSVSSFQFGNQTYVFVYFIPANCPPPNPCDMVQNGGFENLNSGSCGLVNPLQTPFNVISCWENYYPIVNFTQPLFPAIFSSATTCATGVYNLGVNTLNTIPPVSSYNGSANTKVVGLTYAPLSPNPITDVNLKSPLAAPLIPGQSYTLSFWVINHNHASNGYVNPNSLPLVLSIASSTAYAITPTLNFPSGLNLLKDFTITANSAWTQITATFSVPSTPTVNQNAIFIGIDPVKTSALSLLNINEYFLCFLDDISITGTNSPVFSIPNINNCGVASYTDLAQYATSIPGTFSGVGVSTVSVGGGVQYNFVATAPGNYPVTFNYTASGTCTGAITQNIIVSPSFPLAFNRISGCNGASPIETITVGNLGYTATPFYYWEPGYLMGTTQTLSPGVYTVTGQFGSCVSSETLSVNPPAACCSTSTPSFTETLLSSNTLIGGVSGNSIRITNSFTVDPGVYCSFQPNEEYLMNPNIKICVAAGATLAMAGVHLYTCGDYQWKGIEIFDWGQALTMQVGANDCLIEDAETAFYVHGQLNSTITALDVRSTVFNRNLIDISYSDFPTTSHTYSNSLYISDCVFTCRSLTFTPTSWQSASTLSTGLRYSQGGVGALASPYTMQNKPLVFLKSPYSSEVSNTAVKLTDVGVTTGTSYPLSFNGISLTNASAGSFNLFDAHQNFITAVNTNVKINNCVFQNTQPLVSGGIATVAPAVDYSCNNISNYTPGSVGDYELDMSAPNATLGNRFYDCYKGIVGNNPFSFKLSNSSFKSTHLISSLSNTNIMQNGQSAVFMRTNQMEDYIINNNEFNNVTDGVVISLYPENVFRPGFSYIEGTTDYFMRNVYVHTLTVNSNTFTAPADGYLKNAVSVATDLKDMVHTQCCGGIHIESNIMNEVFNGVRLTAINPYTLTCKNVGTKKIIRENRITLAVDPSHDAQRGVEFTDSKSEQMQFGQRLQTVEDNTITVTGGTGAQTVTSIELYHGENNGGVGPLYPTPHVICNNLSNANKGFVFTGANNPASWKANVMEDLRAGMTLSVNGVIGQQGDASHPTANEWNGSWTGSSYGIYTFTSTAALSPIYVNTLNIPPNPNGNPSGFSYLAGSIYTATGSSYDCDTKGYGSASYVALPSEEDYSSAELYYIAKTLAYRYLAINDSMRGTDDGFQLFYEDLESSSIQSFFIIERAIGSHDFTVAEDFLSVVESGERNSVETNYLNFYTVLLKYTQGIDALTDEDMAILEYVAALCPAYEGPAVYQARALYQRITGRVYNGPDACGGETGGRAAAPGSQIVNAAEYKQWNVELFPNPAQTSLNLVSKKENEQLHVTISDISGRKLIVKNLKTNGFIATLEFDLINGVYFININNTDSETVVKKLLIAK